MTTVKFKMIHAGAIMPFYASEGAAGADLHACLGDDMIVIEPGDRAIIPCGFSMEIPQGWEAQIRPRSGIAAKYSVTVLNSPGTIDSDYRGELAVILINHGMNSFNVRHGDRIAQMVFAAAPQLSLVLATEELSDTVRGEGKFGSTGK